MLLRMRHRDRCRVVSACDGVVPRFDLFSVIAFLKHVSQRGA